MGEEELRPRGRNRERGRKGEGGRSAVSGGGRCRRPLRLDFCIFRLFSSFFFGLVKAPKLKACPSLRTESSHL